VDTDVIIVGAGHNGLVAAGYLARAGLRVVMFERLPHVGGAAVTQELWPGFRMTMWRTSSRISRPIALDQVPAPWSRLPGRA
jgi:phytoene dehydrogenase-like protein